MSSLIIKIISISASTYIAFILAISRFFKFDTTNENIGKVIERYSFIINRLEQQHKQIDTFDFKKENLSSWNEIINKTKKESITDIITKANEEKDSLITLKDTVYYQKIYIKLKLKKEIDRQHFNKAINLAKNIKSKDDLLILKSLEKKKSCSCFRYNLDFESLYNYYDKDLYFDKYNKHEKLEIKNDE